MGDCCCGMCSKCHAGKYIVLGLVLVVNQMYLGWDIWVVLGVLLILKGILKWVKPNCPHCEPMPMKKGRK
ncbi:hypothetical protein HYX05_03880 [Candidatus Woesearchaeota archaeon]|nr:hypothetical protein [Candidatus Woesearchaeota archaeon]